MTNVRASTAPHSTEEAPPSGRGHDVCRFCSASLSVTVADLGTTPLAQSLVRPHELASAEMFYPLHARVCEECWLVQIPELVPPEVIFGEYAYFSSYSDSWVEHARRYVEAIVGRAGLTRESLVVELGSNDGYLLRHFVERDIPVLGVDPAANVGEVARENGVPTLTEFFGLDIARGLAAEARQADLVIGNNVLAQVPDLNDFVEGVKALLAPQGLATFEFPHLPRLLERVEYDTIYHEHFSYFSLFTLTRVLAAHGLVAHDVEELVSHGGSLRVFVGHAEDEPEVAASVSAILEREARAGLRSVDGYERFAAEVVRSKHALLELLVALKRDGKQIVGYGAAGKATTLLNYCGIRTDFLDYVVDRNPYKQGAFTPGTRIPIHDPERIAETRPDAIVVLPWNLVTEISSALEYTGAWGAQLVVPIPRAYVLAPGARPGG